MINTQKGDIEKSEKITEKGKAPNHADTGPSSAIPRPSPKLSPAAERILQQASLKKLTSTEGSEEKEQRINTLIADAKKQAMQWMAAKAGKEAQEVKMIFVITVICF